MIRYLEDEWREDFEEMIELPRQAIPS